MILNLKRGGLLDRVTRPFQEPARDAPLSVEEWASYFSYNNIGYLVAGMNGTLSAGREEIASGFAGYVQGAYKANGVVFACQLARLQMFSAARFQYRQLRSGRPGEFFGTADLELLEHPWPGATTGDLLARMIQDADLGGNAYIWRKSARELRRLRPDWVTIVLGSDQDPDVVATDLEAELLGYIYEPGGKGGGKPPVALDAREVAHFAPLPDPIATHKGMSWLTPVLREIAADSTATNHKRLMFEGGGTPNMIVTLDKDIKTSVADAAKRFEEQRSENPFKTLFLSAGTTANVVGANLEQLDFKVVQAAGETRIAAASGVPPVIVGLSEGLEAATYSNYGLAMRRFADLTMNHLWQNASGSLSTVVAVPQNSELWVDPRDIPALREDVEVSAKVTQMNSATIGQLVNNGFTPESSKKAVVSGDLTVLEHTNLLSVQLQPPGTTAPPSNGSGDPAAIPTPT